jgi:ribose transport system ATP-binding protein
MTSQVRNAVELEHVSKAYGAFHALSDATLSIRPGTVHALVGENGAGKSTALGVVAGRVAPTSGRVLVDGRELPPGSPRAARAAGLAAIYQELTIVPALTAMENVFLGSTVAKGGWLDRRDMESRFEQLSRRLGAAIRPSVRADRLSLADQQLLEIMRALHTDARIILLDEPTASLAAQERASLFELMRSLRASGITMAFVSHNLGEVLDISDHVTVFRDGRITADGPASGWNRAGLIQAMLGSDAAPLSDALGHVSTASPRTSSPAGDTDARPPVLEVRGLNVPGVLEDVSFRACEGEILGIAGLVGSGRTSTLRALAGLTRGATGSVIVNRRRSGCPRTVRAALKLGIALVPEDRKGEGLVLGQPSAPNITMSDLSAVARRGYLRPAQGRRAAAAAARGYGLDERMMGKPVRDLSGGNQQKVVLARWAHRPPTVLLADEPGRGIDIGAKAQILASLQTFAAAGRTVVMVSSESEELLAFADRILVLRRGRVAQQFDNRNRDVTEHQLLTASFDSEPLHVND